MLDKESSVKLLDNILEQVNEKYAGTSGTDALANKIARIAATVSVIAFQEYEKMNQ